MSKQDELLQIESSQRQHYDTMKYHEEINLIVEKEDYNLFAILKPILTKDGNQWCCLYGKDLQSGIAGFGDSPFLAIVNWNLQWRKNIEANHV